ncbi:Tho complex subunit 7-domain-containing protein [Xylogone sp. PMI_703]|nr:Tho complex subunit 7-domain-containing protein [Xylogone sp. PMI_703]
MASYQLLDQREEDELHKSRLLNVEEKPFKRITKRLLTPGSLVSTPSKLPTPPLDNTEDAAAQVESENQKLLDERRQFREDVLLDFAAFDSSIARIQFLFNSNERERERYKADKQHILDTSQAVRESTVQLRAQLEVAKATLEQRKKFDKLAEKITSNRLLRPREDQEINLRKLEEECKELERESLTYSQTWKERREQFGRIVEEGMQLRRLIRDEKEEVERREGMDGGEGGGEEDGEVGDTGSREAQTPRPGSRSGNATPHHDGALQNLQDGSLKPDTNRITSRGVSPSASELHGEGRGEGDDAVMTDAGAKTGETTVADTPMGESVNTPQDMATPRIAVDEREDGETEDKMDTT